VDGLWRLCCGVAVGGPFAGGRPSVFHRSPSLLVRWGDAWGAVAGGRRHGRPPDGASCSRCAGLQQCKSFVEMCIVAAIFPSAGLLLMQPRAPANDVQSAVLHLIRVQPRATYLWLASRVCRMNAGYCYNCYYGYFNTAAGQSTCQSRPEHLPKMSTRQCRI
jgi:hypothetical protein